MHRQAAGDTDRLPGDIARVIARQEGDHTRIIFGHTQALHRNGSLQTLLNFFTHFRIDRNSGEQRRIGRSGANRVHANSVSRILPGQRLTESNHTALTRGINGFTG